MLASLFLSLSLEHVALLSSTKEIQRGKRSTVPLARSTVAFVRAGIRVIRTATTMPLSPARAT